MEQETKKCPYCGEEIMATAKKCKHFGKWLVEARNMPRQQYNVKKESYFGYKYLYDGVRVNMKASMTTLYFMERHILFLVTAMLLLCSCNDSKIAKDMEGTWTRSYITSYEDGTKSHVDEQTTFNYDATDEEKDGGTFIEICTGQEETEEDEINAKYRWVSKIEGTWKIEFGSLYQHYDLSTLEVEISKNDVNLKIKDEAWLWNDWGELLTTSLYTKQTIHENLKKETYKELFHAYKRLNNQDNQNVGFANVQVKDDVLSYETGDMGKVKFYRVKEGKTQNRKRKNDAADKVMPQAEETDDSPVKLTVKSVEYWDNVLDQGSNTYVPTNMLDGDPATAWAVNLDNASYDDDKLYGPVFTLRCRKLSHIIIHNGYAKSQEAYSNNARALRIIICNANNVSDEDETAFFLFNGSLNDTPEWQTLRIEQNLACNNDIRKIQLIFPVDGLKKGSKWNDLCISEVEFYGYE